MFARLTIRATFDEGTTCTARLGIRWWARSVRWTASIVSASRAASNVIGSSVLVARPWIATDWSKWPAAAAPFARWSRPATRRAPPRPSRRRRPSPATPRAPWRRTTTTGRHRRRDRRAPPSRVRRRLRAAPRPPSRARRRTVSRFVCPKITTSSSTELKVVATHPNSSR